MGVRKQQLLELLGSPPSRLEAVDELCAEGFVHWSFGERQQQLLWALLGGCGDLEAILTALIEQDEPRCAARNELLAWRPPSYGAQAWKPSRQQYLQLRLTLEKHSPSCIERELLARIVSCKQPLNAIELPSEVAVLELFAAAGANFRWTENSQPSAEVANFIDSH